MKKSTSELLKIIEKSNSIKEFVDDGDIGPVTLPEYLNRLLIEKDLEKSDVIEKSGLQRVFGYKIFNGEKNPTKYKLLCLAFAFSLNLEETQRLLSIGRCANLYPRIRRDSIIIFAINKKISLIECNRMLYDLGEEPL